MQEDKIYDIMDNINSILFCLDNEIGTEGIESAELIKSIDRAAESVLRDISRFRGSEIFKQVKSEKVKDLVKGKLSSRVSLLYKIFSLKDRIRREGESVKVSKNVLKYLQNDI